MDLKSDEDITNEPQTPDSLPTKLRSIVFPEALPISEIVETAWNEDELKDIKIKSHQLYKKYVEEGAALEINISYVQRYAIIDKLSNLNQLLEDDDININVLYEIFDEAIGELIYLLRMSFNRFRYEVEFLDIQDVYIQSTGTGSRRTSAIAIITNQ